MPDNVFPSQHPLVAHKLTLLRSVDTKPKKFRELVRELAILLCYEATTDLETEEVDVTTPMGQTKGRDLKMGIGLVPVLRAGLGMVEGIWEMMPGAEVWHIGLKRDERTLQPMQYYANKPVQPRVQVCLILDPMLATGGSLSWAIDKVKENGAKDITAVCVVTAPEGLAVIEEKHPDVRVVSAALDRELNPSYYIAPGLGDMGDRLFGTL